MDIGDQGTWHVLVALIESITLPGLRTPSQENRVVVSWSQTASLGFPPVLHDGAGKDRVLAPPGGRLRGIAGVRFPARFSGSNVHAERKLIS